MFADEHGELRQYLVVPTEVNDEAGALFDRRHPNLGEAMAFQLDERPDQVSERVAAPQRERFVEGRHCPLEVTVRQPLLGLAPHADESVGVKGSVGEPQDVPG
jgi:hypothetical protein